MRSFGFLPDNTPLDRLLGEFRGTIPIYVLGFLPDFLGFNLRLNIPSKCSAKDRQDYGRWCRGCFILHLLKIVFPTTINKYSHSGVLRQGTFRDNLALNPYPPLEPNQKKGGAHSLLPFKVMGAGKARTTSTEPSSSSAQNPLPATDRSGYRWRLSWHPIWLSYIQLSVSLSPM
jgi:hypothetical protein